MNQPSAFQQQYPLSPKKFWKKLIEKSVNFLFMGFVLGFSVALVGFINGAATGSYADMQLYIILGIVTLIVVTTASAAIYGIYVRVYIKKYYYDCSDQFITIKKRVFTPTEIHVQYQKIQDVYVDQDLLDRMIGIYDVHIASATVSSGIEAHIDGVSCETAESIKDYLLNKIQGGSAVAKTAAQKASQNMVFKSKQAVSSQTYPIVSAWNYSAFAFALIKSLAFTAVILYAVVEIFSDLPQSFYQKIFLATPIVFVVILLINIISFIIWKKNYYFEFLPEFILMRTGIISRREVHLPYKSIQDVINRQEILERMLGISTVVVTNAAAAPSKTGGASGIAIVGQPKEKAAELNKILNGIVGKQGDLNSMGL